jgi:hypothetical protein
LIPKGLSRFPKVDAHKFRKHGLDPLLKVMQATATAPPSGLSDNAPVDYFGATVIHGYLGQPAIAIIRLSDTQTTFSVSGAGAGSGY